MDNSYSFKLFVFGLNENQQLVDRIDEICKTSLGADNFDCSVIDLKEQPEAAIEYKILTIPTLILEEPQPVRRFIGDLTDSKLLIDLLH